MLFWSDLMYLNKILSIANTHTRTHTFTSGKQDVKQTSIKNEHTLQKKLHKGTLYTHKYTIYTHTQVPTLYTRIYNIYNSLTRDHRILFCCSLFCQPLIEGFAVSGTLAKGGTAMATMPKVLGFGLPTLAACIVGDPPYVFPFVHSTLLLKCPMVPVPLCESGHRSSWSRACTGCWGPRSCGQHPMSRVWCSGGRCDVALPGGSGRVSAWPQIRSLPLQIWREDKLMVWAWCRRKELQLLLRWGKLDRCHRNRVGWSHSLRKDTQLLIFIMALKPERRSFVLDMYSIENYSDTLW